MVKQYQVVLTVEAKDSLRKIIEYVRRTDSVNKAKYVKQELLKSSRLLVSLPNSHPVLLISPYTELTYRFLPIMAV